MWTLSVLVAIPPLPAGGGGGGGDGVMRRWLVTDHLGSGTVWIDEDGMRVRHTEYAPFGTIDAEVAAGDVLSPWLYAGHRRELATGLNYMQARWYLPTTGTFACVDPIVANTADAQALNSYAYARNNPLAFVDPTGMGPDGGTGGRPFIVGTIRLGVGYDFPPGYGTTRVEAGPYLKYEIGGQTFYLPDPGGFDPYGLDLPFERVNLEDTSSEGDPQESSQGGQQVPLDDGHVEEAIGPVEIATTIYGGARIAYSGIRQGLPALGRWLGRGGAGISDDAARIARGHAWEKHRHEFPEF